MPQPDYSNVKKASDIPPLPMVVKDMLKDYNLPPDGTNQSRASGR